MAKLLAGKLALVTGAGSGIGRATVNVLAREGASVIAADKNKENVEDVIDKLTQQYSGKHCSTVLDVSKMSSVKDTLDTINKVFHNYPTVIINCAGITRDNFLLKLSEEDFDEVIKINLKGTFLVMQTFANALVENQINNASIVNIASIVGKYGNIGQANYTASKAGVELLTKTAAKEFGKFGIRVNAVLPGFIKTPMTDAVPQKVKDIILQQIPLGRMGNPEEIAEVILFLASDRSSYINGASIDITGGF